MVDRSLQIIHS